MDFIVEEEPKKIVKISVEATAVALGKERLFRMIENVVKSENLLYEKEHTAEIDKPSTITIDMDKQKPEDVVYKSNEISSYEKDLEIDKLTEQIDKIKRKLKRLKSFRDD